MTVVAFENKVPMSVGDHSLSYCQENLSVRICQLSRTAYDSFVDLRYQQFCKVPLMFLEGFFLIDEELSCTVFDIHKNYLTAYIVRKFHKFLFGFIKLLFSMRLCVAT